MKILVLLDLALVVASAALIVAGIARWNGPAAFVVAGLALIGLGLWPRRT